MKCREMMSFPLGRRKENKSMVEEKRAIGLMGYVDKTPKELLYKMSDAMKSKAHSYGYICNDIYGIIPTNDKLSRVELATFVYKYAFNTDAIVVNGSYVISSDEIELKIFIAIMKLINVSVFDTEAKEILAPDPVYVEEIGKVYICRCGRNPLCCSEDPEIAKVAKKVEIIEIMCYIWQNVRNVA